MPAKSKSQQRFMGMVHALQKGELSPSKVSDKVKDVADNMSDSDAEDFASTKHKGKPEKVAKEVIRKIREVLKPIVRESYASMFGEFTKDMRSSYEVQAAKELADEYDIGKVLYVFRTNPRAFDKAIKDKMKEMKTFNKAKKLKEGVKAQKAYNNIHKARNEFIERYSKLRKQLNTLKTESPNNEILRLEKQLYKFEMAFIEHSSKLLGSVSKIAQSNLTEATSSKDLFSGYKVAKWEVYVADETGKEKIMKVAKSKRAGVILYNKLINTDKYHEVGMRVIKEGKLSEANKSLPPFEIAKRMMKSKYWNKAGKGFSEKVIKKFRGRGVTPKSLDKWLPDYIEGKEISKLFEGKLSEAKESGIDVARRIVKNHQHEKGVDVQTANLIMKIHKAYDKNPGLQKKFEKMPLKKMAQGVWRFVK